MSDAALQDHAGVSLSQVARALGLLYRCWHCSRGDFFGGGVGSALLDPLSLSLSLLLSAKEGGVGHCRLLGFRAAVLGDLALFQPFHRLLLFRSTFSFLVVTTPSTSTLTSFSTCSITVAVSVAPSLTRFSTFEFALPTSIMW